MILKIKLEIIGEKQLNKLIRNAQTLGFAGPVDTELQKRAATTYLFRTICNKEIER